MSTDVPPHEDAGWIFSLKVAHARKSSLPMRAVPPMLPPVIYQRRQEGPEE
jgi:hypothetical protein